MFANIIVNSTLIGNANPEDGRKYLYDETIDKIDEKLFDFLLRMSTRRMLDDNQLNKGWRGDDSEDLKELGINDKTFYFNSDYLLSVGVLVRLPRFKVQNGHLMYHDEYFVTQYGLDFVEYVKNQELMEFEEVEEC